MDLGVKWDGTPSIILDIKTLIGVGLPVQVKNIGFTGVFSDLELKPVGILEVKLVQAKELTNKDLVGKSDPYAVLYICPLCDKMKTGKTIAKDLTNKDLVGKSDSYAVLYICPLRDRMKTGKTINNNLNPIQNEHYEFVVEHETTQHLTVKLYDSEGVQNSELLGCARVHLNELQPGKVKDVWLKLVRDLDVARDTK